ncbi:MAG: signal peptidase II [Nocardioides sp.]
MQAARGTSVTDSAADRRSVRRPRQVFVLIAAVAYAADQVSKAIALERLDGRGDVPFLGEVLQFRLTFNPGAAFSMGTGFTPVLTVVAMVAAVVVLWFARRIGSLAWGAALGFLLAGIVGNLTDRMVRDPGVFQGHVVDFLKLPNWPIFNIADVCINVAAGLIILQAIRGVRLDGSRDVDRDADADDDAEDVATDVDAEVNNGADS